MTDKTDSEKICDFGDDVTALIFKAGQAEKSEDAMRFSQAATNSANALTVLHQLMWAKAQTP